MEKEHCPQSTKVRVDIVDGSATRRVIVLKLLDTHQGGAHAVDQEDAEGVPAVVEPVEVVEKGEDKKQHTWQTVQVLNK